MRDIGKNIRDLRIQAGLSQEQLAERLYVTRQTVSNYENDRTQPDLEQLRRITAVLDVHTDDVLYGPLFPAEWSSALDRTLIGAGLTVSAGILYFSAASFDRSLALTTELRLVSMGLTAILRAVLLLLLSWTLVQALSMAMPVKAPQKPWARRLRWGVLAVTLCGLLLPSIPYALLLFNVKLLYVLPDFLQSFLRETVLAIVNYSYVYPLLGTALRLLDFPTERPAVRKSFTKLFR